jgi:hypothetical protein
MASPFWRGCSDYFWRFDMLIHAETTAKKMNFKTLITGFAICIFGCLIMMFLTSCSAAQSLGFSIETQYGRFTYTLPQELPEPIGTKK